MAQDLQIARPEFSHVEGHTGHRRQTVMIIAPRFDAIEGQIGFDTAHPALATQDLHQPGTFVLCPHHLTRNRHGGTVAEMRRPATKQPYAWFRTATRNRGRPVHRLYRPTPRPEGGLTWVQFDPGNIGKALGFTKDFNFWWVLQHNAAFVYDVIFTSTEPGHIWNYTLWGVTSATGTTWADVVSGPGRIKGAFGALPFAVERIITSP